MITVALLVRLHAKPGQENALAQFLIDALRLANEEAGTPVWFALRFDASTFGIFDAFASDAGRKAHIEGRIASALFARADELLAHPPAIEAVDVIAAKSPNR